MKISACVPALLAFVLTAPPTLLTASELRTATQNMRLAMEICLRNYRSEGSLQAAFTQAGYRVSQRFEPGDMEFEAPGVWGGFTTSSPEGYCYIQSQDVPLAIAEDMGLRLTEQLFPGKVEQGSPERSVGTAPTPCEGLSVFATQTLIRITYSAAGNSGDCVNDGSSAIAIKM